MAEENISSTMPDLSGIMDIISKNPELVEKAASILGGMKSGGESSPLQGFDPSALGALLPGLAQHSSEDTENAENAAGGASVPTILSKGNHRKDRSCELLRALKPYLSKERCDAIDYMLNFSKLGDLIGTISPMLNNKGGE